MDVRSEIEYLSRTNMYAASVLIVSDCKQRLSFKRTGCFKPLPRDQVIDLLEATGEFLQTQLTAPELFGDLDLQSMEPSKTILQAKHQHSLGMPYVPVGIKEIKKRRQIIKKYEKWKK